MLGYAPLLANPKIEIHECRTCSKCAAKKKKKWWVTKVNLKISFEVLSGQIKRIPKRFQND